MKRFQPIYSDTAALNQVQNLIEDSLGSLADLEILNGKLIQASVGTAGNDIAHGLGRSYKGVLVAKIALSDGTAYTGVVREAVSPDDSLYVRMISTSGTPNVSLWVF